MHIFVISSNKSGTVKMLRKLRILARISVEIQQIDNICNATFIHRCNTNLFLNISKLF